MSREDVLRQRLADGTPDLVAKIRLFSAVEGGRTTPVELGWVCPFLEGEVGEVGWSGFPLLEKPMAPGESRTVGVVFLCGSDAADALRKAGRFQLSEGRVIGEGTVVVPGSSGVLPTDHSR